MLLSRVANSIYWMTRYIERAENIARFIDVNLQLSLDQFTPSSDPWGPLIDVTGDRAAFDELYDSTTRANVMRFLTLDRRYPNSIANCIALARDNARTIRDIITSEMWQQINAMHITVKRAADDVIREDRPVDFYRAVKEGCLLFSANTDATMSHNEGFEFCKLGRMLERADKTSRVMDVKYFLLLPDAEDVGGALDTVQWAALLRSVGALEMYRQVHGVITPGNVAAFLILDRQFPRSLTHCLEQAQGALVHITGPHNGHSTAVQRCVGRLRSQLQFSQIDEIIDFGLHEYIDDTQTQLNKIDEAIDKAFFRFTPPAEDIFAQQSAQMQQ
ncbi:alpha-E domain-containing protein [Algisphaera agarilytica]|uniref:Putative alpha-E superfamily protein n=1 Tax=Algisphaera agarilytica TaxID=1385975 RepID=A0A7X0H4B3_9BACT|nr:alpha-E domain-containing protein [Algisphaera agarilytica]MBB6429026.1 putative alpha-E superfamily protein [Algisphaera agarilytica]